MSVNRADIIETLQGEILRLQGLKFSGKPAVEMGLGPINKSFPNNSFPLGVIHEFITSSPQEAAPTCGFVSGLLSTLLVDNGVAIWISAARTLFPPSLKTFGLNPDHIIFLDLEKEKDVLWAMEEALKCPAVSAVVGEMADISFTASRRLQLAVEQSCVTGFVIRRNCRKLNTTACVSRWRIVSLPSDSIDDLPGVGYPKWRVELLRIRNGKAGTWNIRWVNGFEVDLSTAPASTNKAESDVLIRTQSAKTG